MVCEVFKPSFIVGEGLS